MADHLDSTKLMPFKTRRRNGYHLPGLAKEEDEQIINEVDPELRPDEQSYVRHYLAYADIMLKGARDAEIEEAEESKTSAHAKTASDRDQVNEIAESTGSSNGTDGTEPEDQAA
jgi:hypothetical protein